MRRIAIELYSTNMEELVPIPSDESHVYRLVLGDRLPRIVKVDRDGWNVVAREQVAFPALRAQGLVEFPDVEFTQADVADTAATFMVMPETKSIPAEELWRTDRAPRVVAHTGDFLRRLGEVTWQSIPGARSPEAASRDIGRWFRDWFAPLLAAPWWTAAAQDVVDERLRSIDVTPTQFGGWQFGQLLTDGGDDEFTVVDWTNLGAYWSLNDVASTIASLGDYHPKASATLGPVLLSAYTGGSSLSGNQQAELALWQAKWLLFSAAGRLRTDDTPGAQHYVGVAIARQSLGPTW